MTVRFMFGVDTGATHPLANGDWSPGLNKQHNITYERFGLLFSLPCTTNKITQIFKLSKLDIGPNENFRTCGSNKVTEIPGMKQNTTL